MSAFEKTQILEILAFGKHSFYILKTLHFGTSTYPSSTERCYAVGRRAAAVHVEYLKKARLLDQKFLETPEGRQGAVELKLRSFGVVRGVVFGTWAEASPDVHTLLAETARVGAIRNNLHGEAGDTAPGERLARILRFRWGIAALRANARLLLERLGAVGRGAAAAADRRTKGMPSWLGAGAPRLWRRRG